MSFFCQHPSCPGYPHRASEKAHPAKTCGPWSDRAIKWRFADRREGQDDLILRALGVLLRFHAIASPPGEPLLADATQLITEIDGVTR